MAVISFSREASKDEMGREIDRRGAVIDALTEERDRLKQWQADQVEVIDEAKALITELNADKKALEAERDRLKEIVDGTGLATAAIAAERDRLAKANAELLASLASVLQACDEGRMVARGAGGMTIDAQIRRSVINGVPAWPIEEARALLDKHKATSTEGE